MVDIAINVDHVSKTFKLPHERAGSVKNILVNFARRKKGYEIQQVLKDVSFEIKKGEFFGIVGRNGSGKSTLLKMLAGIYTPTEGNIQVNGKLTPFIELGVGFNPELTGRENVFLNGALLGFNRKEMEEMYDDIVSFAELSKFMDQKLKNYSSGMQVRLAFSIAIRAKSDILVLDEVLAVGDEAFQQKCIDVFEDYKAQGQTVVLVTHDMAIVRRFCSKAMLISNGQVAKIGAPESVAREYSRLNDQIIDNSVQGSNQELDGSGIEITVMDERAKPQVNFTSGETLVVRMTWPAELAGVKNVGVGIVKQSGEFIFGANTFDKKTHVEGNCIEYSTQLNIGPGKYHIMAGLFGEKENKIVKFIDRGPQFIIKSKPNDLSQGLARLEYEWKS